MEYVSGCWAGCELGAVQLTVAWALPAVALTAVGAAGTASGVAEVAEDAAEVPPGPVSLRVYEYAVLLVNPVLV
jgi:hypothetical protein